MPPVTALPDLTGAIVAHLRASPDIAALAGVNISARRQASWNLPAYAVLVLGGRGGFGEQAGALQRERVDVFAYGPDDRTAHLLWRTVHYYLLPPIGSGRPCGFVAASTAVVSIAQEGGPIRLFEPDTDWPYTMAGYQFTYSADPLA